LVGGECHDLLSRGPCGPGLWVVLDVPQLAGRCEVVPCAGDSVWRSEECRCVGEEEGAELCGEHKELVWSPTGDGVCVCREGYQADHTGLCHEINSRGPCQEGELWLLDTSQHTAHCVQDGDSVRLLEQISSKTSKASSATAQAHSCFVDENGRCRKTLNIRNRFGDTKGGEGFLDWLREFPERGSDCWPVMECEKEGTEGVAWSDGECYQLASTGPCQAGHWLVLDISHREAQALTCRQRDCPQEEVWWSPSCSCFSLNQTARPKSDLESPCLPSERLLVSPYGDGVCAPSEDSLRLFEYLSSSGSQSSAVATRKNCFIDENGRCRKTLNIRGRIAAENNITNRTEDALQDLLTWLDLFPKPSTDCVIAGTEEVAVRELDCHREGKVLFEDGNCYNLLERGPCSEDSSRLVMVVQSDGGLEAECRPRRCESPDEIWEPETCKCYSSSEPGPCGSGERLYEDVFGAGVCGCEEGHEVWADTGECHQLGGRGPCQEGDTFIYHQETQLAGCTDSPNTRVFDLIPPGEVISRTLITDCCHDILRTK